MLLTGCNQTGDDGQFTVTFDSMGGSAVGSVSANEGEFVTPPAEPTRDGYEFTGWYKERECTNLWQFDTDTVSDNLTLYAGWVEDNGEARVTAVSGAEIDDKHISMIVADTVSELDLSSLVTLSSKKATWKLLNENQTQEIDKTLSDLKDGFNKFKVILYNENGYQVNLYSLEIYKKYDVSVKVYVGQLAYPQYDYKVTTLDVLHEPENVELEYATVTAWTVRIEGVEIGKQLPKNAPKEIKIYGTREGLATTVTLDANGGMFNGKETWTVTANYGVQAQLGYPTRKNYIFDGWYDGETLVPMNSSGKTTDVWSYTSDVTLVAHWKAYTLTTTTNIEGVGTYTEMTEVAVTKGTAVRLEAKVTADNTYWIGWYDEEENRLYTNSTFNYTMPEKSKTLIARFGRVTIDWDNDAGNVTDGKGNTYLKYKSHSYYSGSTYDFIAVTRKGYIFTGWFDENGDMVGEEISANITVKAIAEDKTYTPKWSKVTLAKNIAEAGKVPELKDTYIAGQGMEVTAVTALGYNFLGWFDGEEKVSDDLTFTFDMPSENKTYTAKWDFYTVKVNASPEEGGKASMSFTVKFDVNGGDEESTPEPQVATPEQGWTYPAFPTRSGYAFRGWFLEPECENVFEFSTSTKVVHNMTLYAGWEKMVESGYEKRTMIDTRDYYYYQYNILSHRYIADVIRYDSFNKRYDYNYVYFTALTTGTLQFGYGPAIEKITTNHSYVYMDIVNVTKNEVIVEKVNLYEKFKNQTNYPSDAERLNVKAGDVFYCRTYSGGQYPFSLALYFNTSEWNPTTAKVSVEEPKIAVGEETTLTAVTKEGYNFLGWYDGNEQVSSQLNYTFTMTAENREYTAKWTKGVILEKNIEEAGTVKVDNAVAGVGESITLTATTKTGYTFLGWYEGETLIGDHAHEITVTVTADSKTYVAKWIKVTLEKDLEEGGDITAGLNSTYVVGDRVTVTAETNIGYLWQGWYEGNNQVGSELSYSFDMPDANTTLVATWELCTDHTPNSDCVCSKCGKVAHATVNCVCTACGKTDHSAAIEENGYCRHTEDGTDYIYMGYYQQTHKADDVTILSERKDADGYYMGSDGERYVAYRFDSKRGFYFDDGTWMVKGNYYFKVEPIKWRILNESNDGTLTLMSDRILTAINYGYQSVTDTTVMYGGTYTTHPDVPKKTVRINNYQYSYIREWLNEKFYNVAFTANSQSIIQTNAIAGSTSFTSGDRVFLLSKEEATSSNYGFATSGSTAQEARALLTSEYCRAAADLVAANTTSNCGAWMLRTPGNSDRWIWGVDTIGRVDSDIVDVIGSRQISPDVSVRAWGVVPAIKIKLPQAD